MLMTQCKKRKEKESKIGRIERDKKLCLSRKDVGKDGPLHKAKAKSRAK
jgi:hypothetical protein